MRNKKSKAKKEGGVPNGSPGRKRTYKRTTPIGRALKQITKAKGISHYVLTRLSNWEHSDDNLTLTQAVSRIRLALANLELAEIDVGRLKESDWQPPKKQTVVIYEVGDDVEVAEKHRSKYLHVYKLDVILDLRVTKVLPTGQIAVEHIRHGKEICKFILPKTHLSRRNKILV